METVSERFDTTRTITAAIEVTRRMAKVVVDADVVPVESTTLVGKRHQSLRPPFVYGRMVKIQCKLHDNVYSEDGSGLPDGYRPHDMVAWIHLEEVGSGCWRPVGTQYICWTNFNRTWKCRFEHGLRWARSEPVIEVVEAENPPPIDIYGHIYEVKDFSYIR